MTDLVNRLPAEGGLGRPPWRPGRGARRPLRWLAVLAVVALLAGSGVLLYLLVDDGGNAAPTPSPAPTQSAGTTTEPGTPGPGVGVLALWPFTSAAQVAAWQDGYANDRSAAWHLNAQQTARAFLTRVLRMPTLRYVMTQSVTGDTATVEFGFRAQNNSIVPATTVALARYGERSPAAWVVTGATAPLLSIRTPSAGARVRSPVQVTGRITGVDESVQVAVRGTASNAPLGGSFTAGGGQDSPWSVTTRYATPHLPIGFVTAWLPSAVDGTAKQVAVVGVRFADVGPMSVPSYFASSIAGRIVMLRTSDGSIFRYLTTAGPGGGDTHPQVSADGRTVYFLRGSGTCSGDLMKVPVTGGTATRVVAPRDGAVYQYGVSTDGKRVAYMWEDCAAGRTSFTIADLRTGRATGTVLSPALTVQSDPAWSPTGDIAVATAVGSVPEIRIFNPSTTSFVDAVSVPCSLTKHCRINASAYDAAGRLTFVEVDQASQTSRVVRLTGMSTTELFRLGLPIIALAVNDAGDAAIMYAGKDATASTWRWYGGWLTRLKGKPASLSGIGW